jgi:hypothetical protein
VPCAAGHSRRHRAGQRLRGSYMRACPMLALAHAGHAVAARALRLAVLRRFLVRPWLRPAALPCACRRATLAVPRAL